MANEFTWHKVSKKELEKIKKDSESLLNNFSKKLEKIKTKESHFSSGSGMRDEGEPWKTDEEFKEITFSNAPFVEGNLIVAEKGGWKK